MRVHGYDISRILIGFVLVLAVVIGGQRLWLWHAIQRPFAEEITQVQGVTDFELTSSGRDAVKVHVDDVHNLQHTVKELERIIDQYRPGVPLRIVDQRSDKLSDALMVVRFHFEQGMATGQFTPMVDSVGEVLNERGIQWELAIDADNLYVTMRLPEASLYEVVSRPTSQPST